MSIEGKIDMVVDIWIEKGSLQPSHKNKKYNEILQKVLDSTLTEKDLDTFIEGHNSGKYKR